MSAPDESPALPDSAGEERELCRTCLAPNEPGTPFCKACGAPLSSYAATGPFESLFAEGHVYRSAVERPQKLVVVLGMWMLFGTAAVFGIVLVQLEKGAISELQRLLAGFLVAVSVILLWRTTGSYLKYRKELKSRAEPRGDG